MMLPVALVTLGAAAAAPALRPGLWQFTNTPQGASLDGRALDDLPYSAPDAPETICVTPAMAAAPTAFLARDSAACDFTRAAIAGGKVDIVGACPASAPGLARGTVHLTGAWTPTSYALRFATINPGENGVMGFTGTMTGKRIGDCPKP
jgi:hypothetical protein